jgi:hypothetical protein
MFKSKEKQPLARIHGVINSHSRGIYKRIDENRELMELLARDGGPGFLCRNSWVASWLESQDDFLDALRDACGLPVNKPGGPLEGYPRHRPSYNTCNGALPLISTDEICQRIDDNRALIDLLQAKAPVDFMREYPWVDGLLHWQSEFLTKVATVFGVPLPQHQEMDEAIKVVKTIATQQQLPVDFSTQTKVINAQGGVDSGTNTRADERKDDADGLARLKEKHKQLDAIERTCHQSNSTIGGPRFNFSLGIGATIFLALLLLLSFTRLPGWSIFPCSLVVSVSVFYLTKKFSSRPLTWTESIDRLLADYDPIDKDAYRSLQKNAGEDGYIDRCRVSDWLVAERKALRIAHSGVAPVTSEFLRRIL